MGCTHSKRRKIARKNIKRAIRLDRQRRHGNDKELQATRERSGQHLRQISIDNGLHIAQYTDILEEILKVNELKIRDGLARAHGKALLEGFDELRRGELFTDIRVRSKDGVVFPCHRVVISAASETLKEKCLGVETGSGHDTVTLDHVDAELLESVLEYIYTGRYDLNKSNNPANYEMAASLRITKFEEVCYSAKVFLSNNINGDAKWNGFNEDYVVSFLEEINRLRLAESFTDVVVATKEYRQKCHRSLLAASSAFFRVLFSADFEDSTSDVVYLRETDEESVKRLIDFAYTGHVDIDADSAENLLRVANQLQWTEIERLGQNFLEKQIDAFNCIGISYFAETFTYTELSRKARQFALDNFQEVTNQIEFLELDFEQVVGFLEEDVIFDCEETVLEAIIRWVHHDIENRKHFSGQLLEFVIVENLPVETRNLMLQSHPYLESAFSKIVMTSEGGRRTRERTRYYDEVLVFFGSYEMDHRQRNIDVYNLDTEKWSVLSKLPSTADAFVASAVPMVDAVWVCTLQRTTWLYCVQSDRWKEVRPQPGRVLSQYGAVTHGGYIYVIGGCDDNTNKVKATVDRYDPETDSWSMVEPLLKAVGTKSAVVWKSQIFVFGGWDSETYTRAVQRYDIETNTWTYASRCPFKDTCGIAVVARGNFIYVFESGDTYRYDPRRNSWRKMKSMNSPRTDFTAVVCSGKIYALGGVYMGQPVKTVECYDHATDTWNTTDTLDDVTIFSYPRCVALQKKHVRARENAHNKYCCDELLKTAHRNIYSSTTRENAESSLLFI